MVSPLFGQKVYADTSALIYALESANLYPGLQSQFFELFKRGELTLVTSWITFAEVLVKPVQSGNALAEAGYRSFFVPSANFHILKVDQGISDQAARFRAAHGFKIPDAIHIATGLAAGCTHFLTGDAKWTQAGLSVVDATKL